MSAFRVVGPVEAWSGEIRLVLGGPRQVKLLAFLLLNANRAVSADAAIDAVWGAERIGAAKRLHTAVLRLRRALEPLDGPDGPRLRTVSGGYLLSVEPGELDAELISERIRAGRRALEEGDPTSASELLTEALDLWRGPPLAEVAFDDFAQAEIRRLEELHLVALEVRIEADLQLGRHADVIGELDGLLAEHPTREQFAGQLMLALYRAGRQADALEIYQRTRAHLASELGLEPGPALKALQTDVLEQTVELTASTLGVASQPLSRGLKREFPSLRSSNRSNLPTPANPLIGRSTELSDALARSARPEVRLLTLLGAGGAGKTRLAIEVAAEAASRYQDGVWLVPLAPLPEPGLMASEIARVLEIDAVPGQPLERALVTALAERELLLVLDNFEHLLDAAGVIAEILAAAPRVDALATSREPLRISGEHRLEVPPLSLASAGELFVQRARAVRPELVLDAEDMRAIERICTRLDGLPLAVELAAARASVFSPRALEERLAEGLPLRAGSRDLPERQRTLRSTIDWSYELLEPPEQQLLASLSYFVGGVRVDTAAQLWGLDGVENLISLAEKNLLRRREDPDGEPRLWMLEVIRQYASEIAAARRTAADAAAQHARCFFELTEEARPRLVGPRQREWLDRLERDHSNLRAALEYLTEHAPDDALRMACTLTWFWDMRGYHIEARHRLAEALARASSASPSRGDALHCAGWMAWVAGDAEAAEPLLRQAIPLLTKQAETRLLTEVYTHSAIVAEMQRDDARAVALHEQAIAIAEAAGDDWALGVALNNYATMRTHRSESQRAGMLLERALAVLRPTGDVYTIAMVVANLAEEALHAGDLGNAQVLTDEALELARRIEFRPLIAGLLELGAVIALERGEVETAADRIQESSDVGIPLQTESTAVRLTLAAAMAAIRRQPIRAAMLWGAAQHLYEQTGIDDHPIQERLRARYEPQALADAPDQTSWDAAWAAGTKLAIEDALALAARWRDVAEAAQPASNMATSA